MYQYPKFPLMLFSFSIIAGFIHLLLLSPYSPVVSYEYDAIPLFTDSSIIAGENAFPGGPLIYFFYHLFGRLFDSPETAFNVANSLLMATLTYTLLICAVRLGLHSYSLIIPGIWITISPTIHYTLVHYPHLALGLVFYLLLFLSLMRKHYFLILVYLIHLFLTHPVLGFLSLIMTGFMLINRKNVYYFGPLLITIAAIFIAFPQFTGIENSRTIFTFKWHISGSLFTGYLTHHFPVYLWTAEIIWMQLLVASGLVYLFTGGIQKDPNRKSYLYNLILLLVLVPVFLFNPASWAWQFFLAFHILSIPVLAIFLNITNTPNRILTLAEG